MLMFLYTNRVTQNLHRKFVMTLYKFDYGIKDNPKPNLYLNVVICDQNFAIMAGFVVALIKKNTNINDYVSLNLSLTKQQ